MTSTVELSISTQSPVAMTAHGSASRSVIAGTRVTTAPSADFAEIRPMIIPIGAVPDSRVVWKKPDQPDDPLALGKTRTLPVKQTPYSSCRALDDHAAGRVDPAPAGDRLVRHEGLALDPAGDDVLPCRTRVAHQLSPPFQRPVTAAATHSSSVPNQASMPRIAGR